jgi:cytochrome P450
MTMVPTQTSPATQVAHPNAPISDLDPYSDEALIEPWTMYRELQGLGSAVWLTRYQMFALTRYDSVIRALKDASAFSSASGVMMNDEMNQVLRGNTLCSDDADHQRSRRIIGKPLSPTALKSLQEEITSKAERLVERLVSKGTFCAITELTTFLPMDIVAIGDVGFWLDSQDIADHDVLS